MAYEAVIFDVVLTGVPTALWPTPFIFTGWLTCAAGNASNITLSTPSGAGTRVATQSDYFEYVDLNTILASGNGMTLCISGQKPSGPPV